MVLGHRLRVSSGTRACVALLALHAFLLTSKRFGPDRQLTWVSRGSDGERTLAAQPAGLAFLPGPANRPSASTRSKVTASTRGSSVSRQFQPSQPAGFVAVDSAYNPSWLEIEGRGFWDMQWAHSGTAWAAAATALFGFDLWRFLNLVPPTAAEAVVAGIIYTGLYRSRYLDIPKLDKHYQVSFYASVGWTVYAIASLVHGMAYSSDPVLPPAVAEAFHGGASAVYLGSCAYFYQYHWGRMVKHVQQGRFRPWFAAGLLSLTVVHALTVGHIFKVLDDPKWFDTVNRIYTDEWRFLADTRLVELYVTAAALFLVIMHLRGVVTGTLNATIVFLGTVILPTAALFYETFYMNACAWQHYVMYGPKHW